MIVSVPKETAAAEKRVAMSPASTKSLVSKGLTVVVEQGAGAAAGFLDHEYQEAGARIEANAEAVFRQADMLLKVQEPTANGPLGQHEVDLLREGAVTISFLYPGNQVDLVRRLAERKITSFAMELMPRITRAQSMDALSSMSCIAGYKAVLIGAMHLPKFFPMLMTAAGTIRPARVLVLGAGVAGLQAIATARRLGAVVEAYDIRPVVKEQVESLGARFVELELDVEEAQDKGGYAREQTSQTQERLRGLLGSHVRKADVVITTALVPGKRAPTLITAEMTEGMRPGSVVVDIAAEQGGNCELTDAGQEVVKNGVLFCGPLNLPSSVALHASEMYARNVAAFVLHLAPAGEARLDFMDEVTAAPTVTHKGRVVHESLKDIEGLAELWSPLETLGQEGGATQPDSSASQPSDPADCASEEPASEEPASEEPASQEGTTDSTAGGTQP